MALPFSWMKGVVASVPISKQSSISTSGINGTTDGVAKTLKMEQIPSHFPWGRWSTTMKIAMLRHFWTKPYIYIYTYIYIHTHTYIIIHIHIIHTHESRMPTDFATARPRSTRSTDQFWGPDRLKPPLEGPVSFSKASLSFASNPACADCDFIQAWNSPNTWYTGESVKTDVPVFGLLKEWIKIALDNFNIVLCSLV